MSNCRQLLIGLHTYAYDHDEVLPGLGTGEPTASVETRFEMILPYISNSHAFIITQDEAATTWQSGQFTSRHYSYAMLQVPLAGGRHDAWQMISDEPGMTPILSDRNTGTTDQPTSHWTSTRQPGWSGALGFLDGHAAPADTHRPPTVFGDQHFHDDHLFDPASNDDAYLIHSGN